VYIPFMMVMERNDDRNSVYMPFITSLLLNFFLSFDTGLCFFSFKAFPFSKRDVNSETTSTMARVNVSDLAKGTTITTSFLSWDGGIFGTKMP
jgi:hypothetical protein